MDYSKYFPMKEKDLIYFDNAATSFKPKCVIDKITEYYENYSANSHRGDYDISFKVDDLIDNTRILVKNFINAKSKDEIIFTKNTTESLNLVAFGFFEHYLNEGDEVLISKAEHASNVLPWFILSTRKNINIKYIELDENNNITLENVISSVTDKTKVISLAHITNVVGDKRDIKSICEFAHSKGILVVVDGAQSIPHIKTDVKYLDVDFLAFSAHKMCGPMGLGVLYAKHEHLLKMRPLIYGGGMNEMFDENKLKMVEIPFRFEGGTMNLSAICAFGETIEFLDRIGIHNIERHCKYLKNYLVKRLEEIPYITVYNKNADGSIVLINIDGILSGDLGLYLNSKKICVRSGKHCVKMLENEGLGDTVRISLYFYNTYEEVDYLIEVLKDIEAINEFVN